MKTQNEYLETLEEELRYLKQQEINEIVKHYRDKINLEIDYGNSEEKIIKNLPNPKSIAKEIYDSRGISYLEIQKRKYRRKEILQAILSGIIISLMVVLFLGITTFIGLSCFNVISLGINSFSFKSIIDILLVISFVILYILTTLVLYLLIIDLFYLIITHFLTNILKANKKTYRPYYKFAHFTISGFLSEKSKVKKLLPIILICLFVMLLFTLIGSYFLKGYVYRSINDQPSFSEVNEYESNLKEIHIKGKKAGIILEVDETINNVFVEYKYEFTNTFEIINEERVLTIVKDNIESFDVFGLLDEPTPQIIIKLPSEEYLKKLNITLDDGYVYLKNINSVALELNFDIYDTSLYLENISLRSLNLTSYNADVRIMNTDESIKYSKITNMNVKLTKGNIYMQGVQILDNIEIDNGSAEIIFNDCILENLKLESLAGSVILNKIQGESFELSTSSANNVLDNITYDSLKITGSKSTKIEMNRIMVSNSFELNSLSKAIITIKYLKSKDTTINNTSGKISLQYVNVQVDINEENDTENVKKEKETYNNFKLINNIINVISTGETYINDSELDNLKVKQEGMVFQVSKTNIKKAEIDALDVKNLTFVEVFGDDIYFVLNNSPLTYFNYDKESDFTIRIRYKGVSKVETDVKYNVEQ